MATRTSEPGSALLIHLDRHYQISPESLRRIGAFIVMFGTFECDLEVALWRLSGEKPVGQIPSTDRMTIAQRIDQFRHLGGKLVGAEWGQIVTLASDVAKNLAAYRHAVAHGRLLPGRVGGGTLLNTRWHGEDRKRPSGEAHIDERLLGIMLEGLHELLIVVEQVARGVDAPATNSLILGRLDSLRRAKSGTNEVRHLTATVNSDKY